MAAVALVLGLLSSACSPLTAVESDQLDGPGELNNSSQLNNPSQPPDRAGPRKDLVFPPSRDVDAVLRQQNDGSAPPGKPVRLGRPGFSFSRDGYKFRDLPINQAPVVMNRVTSLKDTGPHDAQGVRVYRLGGKVYDHPNFQANYGLENIDAYRLTKNTAYLDRAKAQAQRLIDRRVESRGAWYYPYGFDFRLNGNPDETMRAPWYSGLAQGKVLLFFSRLAEATGEAKWRQAADRTFASFLNAPSTTAPWVVSVDSRGLLWLVEYPLGTPRESDLVFNGHMSAIFGLWQYYRLSKNDSALALFDGAVTTMNRHRVTVRVPRGRSMYDLKHESVAANKYHNLHIEQFVQLWRMTGAAEFVRFADILRDDNPSPVFDEPRTIDFEPGVQVGYNFDIPTGDLLGQKRLTLHEATTGTTIRRMRIKGRGVYYRVATGPLTGLWVPEKPGRVMLRGPVAEVGYRANRTGAFLGRQTYIGTKYDADGKLVDTRTVVVPSQQPAPFDRTAWIDGSVHALIADGPLEGYWVPTSGMKLD
ncbi:D-glucuronyl C5-epimerase family protein [Actinopolymorpha alba]|uniref:D-glucuronyl C5-epimerase family protein n=1 Tax=Actinopolymorpha alba TaxID=533267 RepID=UPI00146A8CF0|nr:D-glucuronyl C5-epimerase family protein [Actinopolymorpha alba]